MSALDLALLPLPARLPDGAGPFQPRDCHTARLTTRLLAPSVAAVTARGEIDASNAGDLVDVALGLIGYCHSLILDLSDLGFFGTEGYSALQTIDRCAPT